jgi:diguanylate cyclase (GGDEF)-like protein/PAS domain S-box-containing protein
MQDADIIETFTKVIEHISEGVYFIDRKGFITFWNKAAERISGYSREQVIGKKCSDNLLKHVDASGKELCVEGCPLAACMDDGRQREAEVFLHHRDGHRVPVCVKAIPIPGTINGHGGCIEIFSDRSDRSRLLGELEELRKESLIDALTGLGNRRFADICLDKACQESRQDDSRGFGILLIDIDFFKRINDEYGHPIGDRVLRMIGWTLANAVRRMDSAARWGGDEFVVIAPAVDRKALMEIASRARRLIERSWISLEDGTAIAMTASIGGAISGASDTPETILARADESLYASKAAGRNRACLHE